MAGSRDSPVCCASCRCSLAARPAPAPFAAASLAYGISRDGFETIPVQSTKHFTQMKNGCIFTGIEHKIGFCKVEIDRFSYGLVLKRGLQKLGK